MPLHIRCRSSPSSIAAGYYSIRSRADDSDVWGYWLSHPDWDEDMALFTTIGQARELAWGRSTRAGGATITRESRIVYSDKGIIIPADRRAPLEGWNRRAEGPGVLIGTQVWLVEDLWQRAWGAGNEAARGYSTDDDDDEYVPVRPSRRRNRQRRVTRTGRARRGRSGQHTRSHGDI
jgi:hypothetical protein